MKVIKKLFACMVLFALITKLSGCFILDDIQEHRNQMEVERRQRIDAIQSEVDYDYVIFATEMIQVVVNGETKIYDVESDIAQSLLSDKIEENAPYSIDSYSITWEKDKAYICVKYHTYEEVADGENNFSFDVALISWEYSTGKSEIVYDYKNVLSPQNAFTANREEYPRVCDIVNENFAVLYENGEIKVIDLQTKKITYTHRVCEKTDRDFYRFYALSGKYLDYIDDGTYYEYTDGTFIPHELDFQGSQYIQNGKVDQGYTGYIFRMGEYLCCDAEEKAVHLMTGEEVSYKEIIAVRGNETSDYGQAFPFYQNGEKYYHTYNNAILSAEKSLIVQFNRDYFTSSEDDTIQQLMLFYDGETKYTPDEIEIKVTNGRCFVFCEYEFSHLGWMEEIGPFIFEYDLQTNELKYIDYWKYFETFLSHNISSFGFSVLAND